ncbi:MAG: hypothetical protein NDJ18_01170 [candidate division Zixibacteria bacterium]|nr:hypothetical protein [candidate division Zixibacteria bacterium]
MKRVIFLTLGCLGLIAFEGCKEKTPNRDYIPVIKQRVYLLQQAIKERSKVALDSLLTDEYASVSGADSVVQFSYGADPNFQFDRFGRTEIFYTDSRARVDGNIVGVDGRILKEMTLTYEHRGERWLLKKIGPMLASPDSVDSLK